MDIDNSVVIARGKGMEEVEDGEGGTNGDGRKLTWHGDHAIYR